MLRYRPGQWGLGDDVETYTDVPASARPDGWQDAVEVSGNINASAYDLPNRIGNVVKRLQSDGWLVMFQRDVDTSWFKLDGRYFELLMKRTDHVATPDEAQSALSLALAAENLGYSALAAYAGEITTQVVVPTLQQLPAAIGTAAGQGLGEALNNLPTWLKVGIGVGVVGIAYVYIAPLLPARSKGK